MTEAEWLASTANNGMLNCLCDTFGTARRKSGRRKLRLFACACCRRAWHKLEEERDRAIVLVAERLANELASAEEVEAARQLCLDRPGYLHAAVKAALATAHPKPRAAAHEVMFNVCCIIASHGAGYNERWRAECTAQASLLREVFGNPFRTLTVAPDWLTPTVLTLASGIDEDRAADRHPILGDALEDAGCTDADILGHLRGPGPHVRGCWVIDLLLAKK